MIDSLKTKDAKSFVIQIADKDPRCRQATDISEIRVFAVLEDGTRINLSPAVHGVKMRAEQGNVRLCLKSLFFYTEAE